MAQADRINTQIDPIFAAIYAHGRAEDRLEKKLNAIDVYLPPAKFRRARKPVDALCAALTATVPTTPGGVAALLWYVWQNQQDGMSLSNDWLLALIKKRAVDAFAQIEGA
jgi:hypothetical protein